MRGEYKQLWSANGAERADDDGRDALPRLRRDTVVAARRQLASLRDDGTIGDDAFHRVEKELDRAELYAEGSGR